MTTCYFLVHGIRTWPWEARALKNNFRALLERKTLDGEIRTSEYGYYSAMRLWWCKFVGKAQTVPGFRWLADKFDSEQDVIDFVREDLEAASQEFDRVIVLAHSFGTWLTINAAARSEKMRGNLYFGLFGGIVDCSFDFLTLRDRAKVVFNFCSMHDDIQLLSMLSGHGSCGRYGFRYRSGKWANVDSVTPETVWQPKDESENIPEVINIHENGLDHSDWIHNERHAAAFLSRVQTFIAVEELRARAKANA